MHKKVYKNISEVGIISIVLRACNPFSGKMCLRAVGLLALVCLAAGNLFPIKSSC